MAAVARQTATAKAQARDYSNLEYHGGGRDEENKMNSRDIQKSKRGVLEDSLVSSLFPRWMVAPVPKTENIAGGPGLDGQELCIHMWNTYMSNLMYKET